MRCCFNVMVVFLISGLWHGAEWTFVLWGAVHGVYQIVGNISSPLRKKALEKMKISENSLPVSCFRTLFTFGLVTFAWIFFRADTLSDAFTLVSHRFTSWGTPFGQMLADMGLSGVGVATLISSLVLLLLVDRVVSYDEDCGASKIIVSDGAFVYLVWVILLAWLLLYSKDVVSTFIYFQF